MNKLLIAICLVLSFLGSAQQEEQSSLYMYNGLFYNPAYAGSRNTLNASIVGRYQWVGFDKAPKTFWASVNSPIKGRNLAAGIHLISDQVGVRKKTSFYGNIAGSIQITKRGKIAAGISLGADNVVLNYTDLHVIDENDPYSTLVYSNTSLNTGVGVYYYGEKSYVGFSIPRIIERKDMFASSQFTVLQRHFYFSAGHVFKINSVLNLKAFTLMKFVPGVPVTADLNASLILYDKYWIGALYRFNESAGINLSYIINNKLTIAYAYDFPINGLTSYQSGSHELALQFDISRYSKNSIYSPRYF